MRSPEAPMRKLRHAVVAAGLALGLVAGIAGSAAAQSDYPSKSVTMIVPFPAGGRTDLGGRMIAQLLSARLGAQIVIVNRPGASSVLGSKEVAQARPDGATLGFFSTSAVTAQYTVPTPLSLGDFQLIAIVNADPAAVAVQETAPWKTLREFVATARQKPDTLRIGMIPGASAQIFAGGLEKAADVKLIDVPFKGDVDGAVALAGGHIEAHVAVPVSYKSLVEAKKVRILAIAAEARSPLYPDLPTFRENGVDLAIGAFHGVFAPKGTPAPIIERVADALEKTLAAKELVDQMNDKD